MSHSPLFEGAGRADYLGNHRCPQKVVLEPRLYEAQVRARLTNGEYHRISLVGLDSATLIGRPAFMHEGRIENLRTPDAVVVDQWAVERMGGPDVIKVGTVFEINDKKARVVGIANIQKDFQNIPAVYSTFERRAEQRGRHLSRLLDEILLGAVKLPPLPRGAFRRRRVRAAMGCMGERSETIKEMHRWTIVVLYAVAMGLVESTVVVYLRALLDRPDPYRPSPLEVPAWVISSEIVREAATIVMLIAVGWLAGRTGRTRFGYFLVAFGVWDIFYYVFLVPLTGWPRSVMDWDILFLIPLPWWGPVLAPVLIATLMIMAGTMMSQFQQEQRSLWPGRRAWGLCLAGMLLALYVFMADAIRVAGEGYEAVQKMQPTWFNWPLFSVALVLLAAPIGDMWRQRRGGPQG